jgi:predicted nucleic acid-binding protein
MSSSTLATEYVTDTMGLVLRIEERKLGPVAKAIYDEIESGSVSIYVPAMVFAEILYLSEKRKIEITLNEVGEYLKKFPNCREYPMSLAVIQSSATITDIGELHDRLIAGTAHLLNLALITNDPEIQASEFVKTIW